MPAITSWRFRAGGITIGKGEAFNGLGSNGILPFVVNFPNLGAIERWISRGRSPTVAEELDQAGLIAARRRRSSSASSFRPNRV